MNIYQIVDSLNFGDAIGNHIIAVKHVIESMGIPTAVYASTISPKIKEQNTFSYGQLPKLAFDDIIIYHMGSGSPLNLQVSEFPCRKILFYHNITPYHFFDIDNMNASENCRRGLSDIRKMCGKFDGYLCASEFSKRDMIQMGYDADLIQVMPIIVPFEDYEQTPDADMVQKLSDGMTNIVFVGRIAPNKKHEDLIRIFDCYQKHVRPNARLILAGSANADGMYFPDLQDYIRALDAQNIMFPGHISFPEILAIYKTADVFLCMSEHEGFCVPMLEAMTFSVPVIAYDAGAVPETLGGAGIVVDSKEPQFVAQVMERVVTDEALRGQLIAAERKRLEDFAYEKIKMQIVTYLQEFIDS